MTNTLPLAASHTTPKFLDTGHNLHHLGESHLHTHDPFNPTSVVHTFENALSPVQTDLQHDAFIRKMELQYFDTCNDLLDDDFSYIPKFVLCHRISRTPHCDLTAETCAVR